MKKPIVITFILCLINTNSLFARESPVAETPTVTITYRMNLPALTLAVSKLASALKKLSRLISKAC